MVYRQALYTGALGTRQELMPKRSLVVTCNRVPLEVRQSHVEGFLDQD